MDELKNRKTTRLKGADYNRNQAVFLTICTKERRCVLSRIVGTGVLDGPQIELTKYGQIADKYIRQLNDFYDDLSVESYVIMPNHIHAIIALQDTPAQGQSLSVILGQYKATVSKLIHRSIPDRKIWQKSYYDRVIRDEQNYRDAWRYIDENPIRWYVNRGLPCPFSPDDI